MMRWDPSVTARDSIHSRSRQGTIPGEVAVSRCANNLNIFVA